MNGMLLYPPLGLGEGPKGQISLNFNYKVNSKYFKPNFVCLLTNEIYRIFIQSPASCPRCGTLGCWGSNINFSEHGHVAYQIKGNDQ